MLVPPYISLSCQNSFKSFTGEPINCSMIIDAHGLTLTALVDYGDGQIETFSNFNDTTPILLTKSYSKNGTYSILIQTVPFAASLNKSILIDGSKNFLYI